MSIKYQESVPEEPDSHHLRFGPFKNVFSLPDKRSEEKIGITKEDFDSDYYKNLFSHFIIGDAIFESLEEKQSNDTNGKEKVVIQANRKSLDKLKRKIKRGIAERAHKRSHYRRDQRIKASSGQGRDKTEDKGDRPKGRDKGKRGGRKSRSPSNDNLKNKSSKKNNKEKKRGSKERKRTPDSRKGKGSKIGKSDRKGGKPRGKRESRRNFSDGRRKIKRSASNSPAGRSPRDNVRRSRRDMSSSNNLRNRRRSGSPPSAMSNNDRGREGRYGKRRRKKFRYSKAIMRRIKARYMKEKAKKIFIAKRKRGHVIKYWRKTPVNRDKQRRVNLEREYGKRGAYEILMYEHREMKIREAVAALKLGNKRGRDFHSGEENEEDEEKKLTRLLREGKEIKKPLQVSDKIQALLKKSSSRLKLGGKKNKKGLKHLQALREYPPGFYESVYRINDIIDSSQMKRFNKKEIVLYGPNKEDRFAVEEKNYEDPWENPERNRIMKVKEKRVKIKILKDFHRKRLREERKHEQEHLPNQDHGFENNHGQYDDEADENNLASNTSDLRISQNWKRTSDDSENVIQGSFQRQVNAGWRNKRKNDNFINNYLKNKNYENTSNKYQEGLVKEMRPQKYTHTGQNATSEIIGQQECYEDNGEDDEDNEENSYEESQYSEIGQESGSDEEEEESRDSDDERSYSEDEESDGEFESQYSGTDQGIDSDVEEDSQLSEEQGSNDGEYASYGESQSQYGRSDEEGYTDATYDSE